jgi:hypothetical protein
VIFLLVVTALFYLRAFVLPKQPGWQTWADRVTVLPIVIRWAGTMVASYFVTRLVLSIDLSGFNRYGSIFKSFSASIANKGPVDFWVELMCIALGLAITLTLLPEGTMHPRIARAPIPQPSTRSRLAYSPPKLMFIGTVYYCLDPFCCFGGSDLLVALMIAGLLWLMLPFLLPLLGLALDALGIYFAGEAVWGRDFSTGEPLPIWERVLGILPFGGIFLQASGDLAKLLSELSGNSRLEKALIDLWRDEQGAVKLPELSKAEEIKPPYDNPGTHDSTQPGKYVPRKTPLPDDAEAVYNRAISDGSGKTWYGINDNGQIYRFQSDNAGKAHFNAIYDPVQALNKVPDKIRRKLIRSLK